MPVRRLTPHVAVALAAGGLAVGGCGGPSRSDSGSRSTSTDNASALSADANSAATGDIPDNQSFLTFRDVQAGYSMRYPEGWVQRGSGREVTFRDKNNLVRITVMNGPAPTVASVSAQLRSLRSSNPTLKEQSPRLLTIGGRPVVKVTYTTRSPPNPVTGKRVALMVDRYDLARNGKVAVVELGTPVGVDNVDAYRMMINSFTWL